MNDGGSDRYIFWFSVLDLSSLSLCGVWKQQGPAAVSRNRGVHGVELQSKEGRADACGDASRLRGGKAAQ